MEPISPTQANGPDSDHENEQDAERANSDESFRARMIRMFEPYRLENQALWVEDRRPVSVSL